MNNQTWQLLKRPTLVISILIASITLAFISLTMLIYLWFAATIVLLSVIIHTALFTDKNKYNVRDDYPYYFREQHALHIAVTVNQHGFAWPTGLETCDTALLRCKVRSRLLGFIRDPYITITYKDITVKQALERGAKGVRFINITSIVSNAITAGDTIHLAGKHIAWETGENTLLGFTNPEAERQRVLIFSPHPDDAEIAAFGLYSQHDSYIITVTAGDNGHKPYQHIIPDKTLARYWCGKLRAFDSIIVPRWGNVPLTHCVNLGYPDGKLAQLATDQTLYLNETQCDVMSAFRQYNCADWLDKQPQQRINWQSIVNEFKHIIDTLQPSAIVCPHPVLDKHPDHHYVTQAIAEAIQQTQHRQCVFYCYQNHLDTTRIAPFGAAHTEVSLPPLSQPLLESGRIFAQPLSDTQIRAKIFALEMMHDLRHAPMPSYSSWRQYRYALAKLINGRQITPYGDDDFYRKAIRPHELFFCYTEQALLACFKAIKHHELWLDTAICSPTPVKCQNNAVFSYLQKYPGHIYRHVKNRQTKAISYQKQRYFVKVHCGISYKEIIKNLIRGCAPVFGASVEWRAILHCNQANILTTPLVCYGKWGKLHRQSSFIMTRALKDTCSLEDLGQTWCNTPPPIALKRQVIRVLAQTARTFHQHGMNHRDFYLCHFLVPNAILGSEKPLTQLPMHIIDLHRVQIRQSVPMRWLVKDISALLFSSLNFSLTKRDYLYFIKHYCHNDLTAALNDSHFWKKVIKRAYRLYYKQNKHAPPFMFSI